MKRLTTTLALLLALAAAAVGAEEAPPFAPPWCDGEKKPIACAQRAWEETAPAREHVAETLGAQINEICDADCRAEKARQSKELARKAGDAATNAIDGLLGWGARRAVKARWAWEEAQED
jgi:hypothetical protein